MIAWAFLLLGAACLVLPSATSRSRLGGLRGNPAIGPDGVRLRGSPPRGGLWLRVFAPVAAGLLPAAAMGIPVGLPVGGLAAILVSWICGRWLSRQDRRGTDPLRLAAGWDLLAAGMRAGLPAAVIVHAVAEEFTGRTAKALREVAALHNWGADPVSAWEPALNHPDTAELARAARRSAAAGSGIAETAADLATDARVRVSQLVRTRAERAAVWVSAPLALCFLPGFLCLGVLPVVVGMVRRLHFVW